jgi:hypothetical protein
MLQAQFTLSGAVKLQRSNSVPVWPLAALLIGLFPLGASAETAHECAAEIDDRVRLACYDRIFGKPGTAVDDRSAAVPSPAAAPSEAGAAGAAAASGAVETASAAVAATTAVPASPEDDFGLTEAAKRARDPVKAQEQLPQSITEVVSAVRRKPTGELVVTLESGQVWSQLHADTRARPSPSRRRPSDLICSSLRASSRRASAASSSGCVGFRA